MAFVRIQENAPKQSSIWRRCSEVGSLFFFNLSEYWHCLTQGALKTFRRVQGCLPQQILMWSRWDSGHCWWWPTLAVSWCLEYSHCFPQLVYSFLVLNFSPLGNAWSFWQGHSYWMIYSIPGCNYSLSFRSGRPYFRSVQQEYLFTISTILKFQHCQLQKGLQLHGILILLLSCSFSTALVTPWIYVSNIPTHLSLNYSFTDAVSRRLYLYVSFGTYTTLGDDSICSVYSFYCEDDPQTELVIVPGIKCAPCSLLIHYRMP